MNAFASTPCFTSPARRTATRTAVVSTALISALAVLVGSAVGPNYHRPSAPVPQRYKEAEGWKPAEPREAGSGVDWWSIYDDATLDGLEKQIAVSNQPPKASEAALRS